MASTSKPKASGAKPGKAASSQIPRELASVTDKELDALGMTQADRRSVAQAEQAQRERMLAEPVEKITVPRGVTLQPYLVVVQNGVSFSLPIATEVSAPASVVALARQRIAAVQAAEDRARA